MTMNATNPTTLWPNQVALDTASDRHVTCDDGHRLDLVLYWDCRREQADALRSQAIAGYRAAVHAALRDAAHSWVQKARRMFSAPRPAAGSSAGSRSIG
jgi:hypothetical protein